MSWSIVSVILLGVIAYTYIGYPLVLKALVKFNKTGGPSRGSGAKAAGPGGGGGGDDAEPVGTVSWPSVSLVVTVHNGGHLMEAKVRNLSELRYPGSCDFHFVLDGCTDDTRAVIESNRHLIDRELHIWESDQRRGKENAIRDAIDHFTGDVLVFSDADTALKPDAVEHLARKLTEPGVGVACGQEIYLRTAGDDDAGQGQGLFKRYENAVKAMQDRCSSLSYVQGGIFAMWKNLYPADVPAGCTQDGIIAFDTVLAGRRVALQADAISTEFYELDARGDFSRRVRTVSRAAYSIWRRREIFDVGRTGWFGFHVLSSRLLRWLAAPLALAALATAAIGASQGDRLGMAVTGLFAAWAVLVIVGIVLEKWGRRLTVFYFPMYFTYIHLAAMWGLMIVLRGGRVVTWKPTR